MSFPARRARRLVLAVSVAALLGLAADASRPPERQVSARAALGAIHLYQRVAAPPLARLGTQCRFTPSCSHYAEAVIRRDGIVKGGWRTAVRIARCGPWTPMGTVDRP